MIKSKTECSNIIYSVPICLAVRTFSRLSAKSLFLIDQLKVFFLHLELSSDQENTKGFPNEWLWFLGHRVELMPFQHLEKFCE